MDVEHEVDFTINYLDKFEEPDGRLLVVEVDGQIAGTISLRKIRDDSGEIKRMFVRPKMNNMCDCLWSHHPATQFVGLECNFHQNNCTSSILLNLALCVNCYC